MGSPEKARQDSILTEIHSLAPYFTYEKNNEALEDNATGNSTDAMTQAMDEQRNLSNWEKQRKEYVFGSDLDY